MPVFHLGNIKYNQLKSGFFADSGDIFLYASSNRCNNLIYTSIEECRANYQLSLLLYNGQHGEIVSRWSNEQEHKLIIGKPCFSGKLLKLSNENVRLVSLKKAEDCNNATVLRFVETSGKAIECNLELFFNPTRAVYITNDERELGEISTDGNTLTLKCKPYSYTAIKVFGNFSI